MSSVSPAQLARRLLRPELLELRAYHVPASDGLIKLDAMENPYALPVGVADEIAHVAATAAVNRYPDAAATVLRTRIRALLDLPEGMDVLLGNGSDELIQLLVMALNRPGACLLALEPSFVMYRMIATFCGMRYAGVPLAADFSIDVPATLAAIEREQPALIFIAYPNNPTGNLFDAAALRSIIEAAPGVVVVDEAYYAFARDSFLPRLADYPNLLVMRTYSKLGMAGLRLGFLAGHGDWLGELDKLRLPYNVGVLPQQVAEVMLAQHDVLLEQAGRIKADRAQLAADLAALDGVAVYPSEANFLLFKVAQADAVFAGLKARGVLIKNLNGGHPMLADCLRVTVGTAQECGRFMDALRDTLNTLQ